MKSTTLKKRFSIPFISKHYGTLIGLLVLCIIVAVSNENFLTMGNFINILRQISTNGIMTVGIAFVIILGGVDLSISSTCAACGCLIVSLLNNDMQILPALLITLAFGLLIGLFNGLCIAYTKLPYFILTLSTQNAVRGIAYIFTNGRPLSNKNQAFNAFGNGDLHIPVGGGSTFPIPYSVLLMIAIFILAGIVLSRTRFGRHLYATGGNKEAATHSGINVRRVQIISMIISSLMATIAGIVLASKMNTGQPTAATGYECDAIAAAVLGGVGFAGGEGTVGNVVIGTIIMGVLSNGMNMMHIDSFYQLVVKGFVILGAVYFDSIKSDIFKAHKLKKAGTAE